MDACRPTQSFLPVFVTTYVMLRVTLRCREFYLTSQSSDYDVRSIDYLEVSVNWGGQAARVIPNTNATFLYIKHLTMNRSQNQRCEYLARICHKRHKFRHKIRHKIWKSGHKTGIVRIYIILSIYEYYCIVQNILIFLLMHHGYTWIDSYLLFKRYYL